MTGNSLIRQRCQAGSCVTIPAEKKDEDKNISSSSSGKLSTVEKGSQSLTGSTVFPGDNGKAEIQFSPFPPSSKTTPNSQQIEQKMAKENGFDIDNNSSSSKVKNELQTVTNRETESFEEDGIPIPGNEKVSNETKYGEGKSFAQQNRTSNETATPATDVGQSPPEVKATENKGSMPGVRSMALPTGKEEEGGGGDDLKCSSDEECPQDAFCAFGICVLPKFLRHKPPRLCFKVNLTH